MSRAKTPLAALVVALAGITACASTPDPDAQAAAELQAAMVEAMKGARSMSKSNFAAVIEAKFRMKKKEVEAVMEALEGLIATNTTIDHQGIAKVGPGGLSGRPLARRSQEVVAYLCERTSKPVIAVGGISSPSDAMEIESKNVEEIPEMSTKNQSLKKLLYTYQPCKKRLW